MKTTMYVMTHKKFTGPSDPIYVPLQVGSALHEQIDPSYIQDNTGDHISDRNPSYSELTGMYWIWKNDHTSDIVGICHYRRYPLYEEISDSATDSNSLQSDMTHRNNAYPTYDSQESGFTREYLYDESHIVSTLMHADMICSKLLTLPATYYDGFSIDHDQKDIDTLSQVLKEKYPTGSPIPYSNIYEDLVHRKNTYFGNILIMRKPEYDKYCSWLFDILFEVEKRTDMTGYDAYRMRLYGFLSEFLQTVYIVANHLRVVESRIAMMGEKAETKEAKDTIATYFSNGDYQSPKEYLIKKLAEKPDLLMEASDISGELKLCMQIISTCEYEQQNGIVPYVKKYPTISFRKLMFIYSQLNSLLVAIEDSMLHQVSSGISDFDDSYGYRIKLQQLTNQYDLSRIAIEIAIHVSCHSENYSTILSLLS